MKNLPLSIQTFSDLITQDYLYIDKTKEIYNLFAQGGKYYFLSRPRRFGKSLLVSTLKEIFCGNKELFKGLWIYDKIEWVQYPVIHLDLSKISFKTPEMLEKALESLVEKIAADFNIQLERDLFFKEKFGQLLEKMSQKQKVVILIDEYDKPLIDYIEAEKIETANQNRDILKNFYSVIKASDEFLRFVFITGVSKFSRMSIFSDLNNLNDITIDENFSTLLGITRSELLNYFAERIKILSKKMNIPEKEFLENVTHWYNGYSWDGCNFLFNPFSIINFFSKNRFSNYWFATGTPTFLIKHIKKQNQDIIDLDQKEVDESIFESYDIENLEVISLLFQTGYLTIKEIKPMGLKSQYILSYPNEEVKESFLKHILADYTTEATGRQ